MAYQFPLNGGRINASINTNGNTAGVPALISTGTLHLAGGNNITLSQNGQSVTISGGAGGGGAALSAGTQSVSTGTVNFANSNGISFGMSGSNQITASHNGITSQSAQTIGGYITGNTTGQSSASAIDARSLSISAMGGASAGFSGGMLQVAAPAVSSLSNTGIVSLSTNGNTILIGAPAFSAGISSNSTVTNQLILAAGNNITLSQSTDAGGATVSISGANALTSQSNQAMSAGNGSFAFQTASFSNANGISFSTSAGSAIVASHNALTSQSNQALSASNGSFAFQTAGFSNANGVTFGTSAGSIISASVNTSYAASNHSHGNPTLALTNLSGTTASASNGLTLSLSGNAAQTNQTLGAYMLGNTTGQSSSNTFDARSMSISGAGNVSVGYSGASMIISGGGGGGGVNIAASNTTFTSGTVVMSNNGGALTISSGAQSVLFSVPATSSLAITGGLSASTNGSTISLGVPGPMSHWIHNSAAMYSSSTASAGIGNGSVSFVRMLIPQNLSFTRVDIPMSVSGATSAAANTAAMALSAVGVIYSRSGATLNPIFGQSSTTTYSYASNTGVYSSIRGARMFSFNLATNLSAGEYYLGIQMSSATSSVGTATTSLGWTVAPIIGTSYSVLPWQEMSAATNASINLYQPLQGMGTVSISNTTQTFQQSQITQSGGTSVSNAMRANLIVMFRNN